jgi:putative flippase GtrA
MSKRRELTFMKSKNNLKELAREFARYLIVGGSAFLVDFGILYLSKTFLLSGFGVTGVYIATALGFIAGLVYNYILSLIFVFKKAKEKVQGKTFRAFITFSVIGVIGLGLTELGMYLGVSVMDINYLLVKVVMAAIVLLWNYLARKFFIFD